MKCVIYAVKTEIKAQDSQRWTLHNVFGPKSSEVTGDWVNYLTSSLMICNALHILVG
jgi:hypothetical protein